MADDTVDAKPKDRVFIPALGPTDWRRLLADPERHWRREKSAFESAVAWEAARRTERGLPAAVIKILDTQPSTANASLVLALPELQVQLPGGGHASQNDVWALLRAGDQLHSLTVEAKSGEVLGPLVTDYLQSLSPASGKPTQLLFLRKCLGLADSDDLSDVRHQLLHRAVSAIIMAERFLAHGAIMLVHSFGENADDKSRQDFRRFCELMKCTPALDKLIDVGRATRVPLAIGWINDGPASDAAVALAIGSSGAKASE